MRSVVAKGLPSARRLVCALLVLLCACDLGRPVDEPEPGTISGKIAFDGTGGGPLVVEAHDTFPPGAAIASTSIDDPTFPQAYVLTGIAPGEVFLAARLLGGEGAIALGTFPSVLEVSPVVLEPERGLRGADFGIWEEGSRPEGPVVEVDAQTLGGTITFEGTVQPGDWLRGALYRTYPPRGAPADFLILNIREPVFPVSFRFEEVRDGNYYTVFYLDRRGDSPFGPGTNDRVAWALGPDELPRVTTISLGAGQTGIDVALPGL